MPEWIKFFSDLLHRDLGSRLGFHHTGRSAPLDPLIEYHHRTPCGVGSSVHIQGTAEVPLSKVSSSHRALQWDADQMWLEGSSILPVIPKGIEWWDLHSWKGSRLSGEDHRLSLHPQPTQTQLPLIFVWIPLITICCVLHFFTHLHLHKCPDCPVLVWQGAALEITYQNYWYERYINGCSKWLMAPGSSEESQFREHCQNQSNTAGISALTLGIVSYTWLLDVGFTRIKCHSDARISSCNLVWDSGFSRDMREFPAATEKVMQTEWWQI